jgi:hypothetical protein
MPKSTAEKIATKREQIQQLQNEEKLLIQKQKKDERAARTRRFCSRHGLLEKFMPDLAAITDEQYETFIKKGINTAYGQKILAEIVGSTGATAAQQTAETVAQSNPAPTAKPPQSQTQNNGAHNAEQTKTTPQGNNNHNAKSNQTANSNTAAESAKADGGTMVTG